MKGQSVENHSPGKHQKTGKYRPLRLSRGMKIFHWWMAGLSALFLLAIPIAIGIIPPIDGQTDSLLFNIGVGSMLAGVLVLSLWAYQGIDDWLERRRNAPGRHPKRNQ
ncbi:hypothetical protein [Glutamicibacter sp. HZAU]|uniref:hypothetical protein n=1 Tax=Glutamicibacter sp. HZAU TaxID=2049891 RepID=UPI000FFCBB89|nr:hypothetical protein [Glutamicibacter sp. HZAU]RWZ84733.1 hypothetical protein EKH49_04565 [Glutamicibacter sp. HZAU]